jgi:PTS system cellobiose-specific IIC component
MSVMDKIQQVLQDKLAPVAGKIADQRHINAMKNGLMATTPLTILGGFALILATPPVDPKVIKPTNIFNKFLLAWKTWSVDNAFVLNTPYNLTMGLLGLFSVIAVAYFLLQKYKMNILSGVIIATLTFLAVVAPPIAADKAAPGVLYMSTTYLDAKGMFLGIIIALLTVEITKFLLDKNIKIKLPDSVPPAVSAPFEALIPLIVNVVVFSTANNLLIGATGKNMAQWILKAFAPLVAASDTLPAMLLVMFILNLLWFFGIHGGNVVNAVVTPFVTMNLAANAEAIAKGAELPYTFSGSIITLFFNVGGSGAAFGLVIAMLIVAKSSHLKSVGKLGFIPDIFGISEPVVFSTPTILNPFLLIPWIVIPLINVVITYFATALNLVGKIYVNIPWTTPGPIKAFLSTMDWRAVVLWFILLAIDIILYLPFVRAYDKSLVEQEQAELAMASNTEAL